MEKGMTWGAALALLALACGGTTADHGKPPAEAGGGTEPDGEGGHFAVQDAGPDAILVEDTGPEAAPPVLSDYVSPVCPDAGPPSIEEECDLFAPVSGCPPGLACYPFVVYPLSADDCAQEQYGTYCRTEGTGIQGEPCETSDCRGSHLCVVTGEGTQCVKLCEIFGEDTCAPGLLCTPIDVQPGVGGCY